MRKHFEKITGGFVLAVILAIVLQLVPWGSFEGLSWGKAFWVDVAVYSGAFILLEYIRAGSADYIERRNQRWKERKEGRR